MDPKPEERISELEGMLERIVLKIDEAREDPKSVKRLRQQYDSLKKELYKQYILLEEEYDEEE